ncbi:hypothetical protein EGW08_018959, partial [Elysia chlorotica]
MCICLGMCLSSAAVAAVSLYDIDNRWGAIAAILAAMFFQAVCTSHGSALPIDLAPRYAGTVMSLSMSVALLLALSGPLTVSRLTPTGSYSEWRVVWYMLSAVFLSSSLVFLIFGEAKIQPWAATGPELGESGKDKDKDPGQQSVEMSPVPVAIEVMVQPYEFDGSAVDGTNVTSATQNQHQMDTLDLASPSLKITNSQMVKYGNKDLEREPPANRSYSNMETEMDNLAFEGDVSAPKLLEDLTDS